MEPSKPQKDSLTRVSSRASWSEGCSGTRGFGKRERGQLAQEHLRTHTQRQWLTSVKSECMMINPSAHGYNIKLCINYRNDSIPKPPCWTGSQRTTLEQLVTRQRINLLHTWESCKAESTPAEHSRVMYCLKELQTYLGWWKGCRGPPGTVSFRMESSQLPFKADIIVISFRQSSSENLLTILET